MIVPVLIGGVGGALYLRWVAAARLAEEKRLAMGLIVAALIYVGFALVGGAGLRWVAVEILGVGLYGAVAFYALGAGLRWLAVGWSAHVVWDIWVHPPDVHFVPGWYGLACVAFDLMVAGYAMRPVASDD